MVTDLLLVKVWSLCAGFSVGVRDDEPLREGDQVEVSWQADNTILLPEMDG